MGLGDWIMATAEARHYHARYGLPVVFQSKRTSRMYWSEVFTNNPKILKNPVDGQQVVVIENYPGHRPYVKCITPERFIFNMRFRAEPGELFLTPAERRSCKPGCVIVEPHTKTTRDFSLNKAWPWECWQELVRQRDLPWIQIGPVGVRALTGVQRIVTPSFRDALGHIAGASLVVTTDGALHHAAAALNVPAVVLWGGLAPVETLGYEQHTNICMTDSVCGSLSPCKHCEDAMKAITVEQVCDAIDRAISAAARKGDLVSRHSNQGTH